MPAPTKSDHLFGEIALKNRLLTRLQLEECLAALEKAKGPAKTIAEIIEKKKLLSPRAIASIARAQNYREVRLESKLYGRIAVKNRFTDVGEVQQCLELQKKAYLKGEPPPDFGELLRSRGHVTAEEDRAIREAMRKLDKESLVGKGKDEGGAGDGDAEGDEGAAEETAAARKRTGKVPAGPPGARRGAKAPAAPAKKSGKLAPKKKAKEESADEDEPAQDDELLLDDEKGEKDDAETAEQGAIGDDTDMPLVTDTQGIDVENLLDDAANAAGDVKASPPISSNDISSSSVSDSASGRIEAPPAPSEELAEEMAKPKPKPTHGDTDDLMDVVVAPGDLAPLPGGDASSAEEDGAAAAAKKPGSGEKRPAAAGEAPAGEGAGAGEEKLPPGQIARVRDVTPPGGVPRLEVDHVRSAHECPQCNVRLEAGLRECLYC
ncbi:MAG TPA: hypothetical protein VHF22_02980, partial [Planctomycetota bacterium]|nr:hypothetical protein [Planctomycetota bacterium]